MAVKLKPCPFCGEKGKFAWALGVFWVRCLKCKGRGGEAGSMETAADAWNKRLGGDASPHQDDATRQDAAFPKGLKTALRARGGSDPHPCRPKPSDAFCKGIPANCKAHPDKGANQP